MIQPVHLNFDKSSFTGMTTLRLNLLRSIEGYKVIPLHYYNFRMSGKEHINKVEFLLQLGLT